MIQPPRWARGLMVFVAVVTALAVVIRWTGTVERLRDRTSTGWGGLLPWILLIVFWIVIVRQFRRGHTDA